MYLVYLNRYEDGIDDNFYLCKNLKDAKMRTIRLNDGVNPWYGKWEFQEIEVSDG